MGTIVFIFWFILNLICCGIVVQLLRLMAKSDSAKPILIFAMIALSIVVFDYSYGAPISKTFFVGSFIELAHINSPDDNTTGEISTFAWILWLIFNITICITWFLMIFIGTFLKPIDAAIIGIGLHAVDQGTDWSISYAFFCGSFQEYLPKISEPLAKFYANHPNEYAFLGLIAAVAYFLAVGIAILGLTK